MPPFAFVAIYRDLDYTIIIVIVLIIIIIIIITFIDLF